MPRILVIEDDKHIRAALHDILELEGHEVQSAADGMQGLELLQTYSTPPDIILCNILMPRMTGWEVLQKLRSPEYKPFADVPFVMITAMRLDDVQKGLEHYGVSLPPEYILQLPFDAEELCALVEKLTGG